MGAGLTRVTRGAVPPRPYQMHYFELGSREEEMALQMDLDKDRYVSLLEKLIWEVEFLQNNPPKFVPQEDR